MAVTINGTTGITTPSETVTTLTATSGTITTPTAGDNTTSIATTAFVSSLVGGTTAAASSLAVNGYQKLPSGLIIQWGNSAAIAPGVTATVTLPISFPAAFSGVVITARSNASVTAEANSNATPTTLSAFTISSRITVTETYSWIAIGY